MFRLALVLCLIAVACGEVSQDRPQNSVESESRILAATPENLREYSGKISEKIRSIRKINASSLALELLKDNNSFKENYSSNIFFIEGVVSRFQNITENEMHIFLHAGDGVELFSTVFNRRESPNKTAIGDRIEIACKIDKHHTQDLINIGRCIFKNDPFFMSSSDQLLWDDYQSWLRHGAGHNGSLFDWSGQPSPRPAPVAFNERILSAPARPQNRKAKVFAQGVSVVPGAIVCPDHPTAVYIFERLTTNYIESRYGEHWNEQARLIRGWRSRMPVLRDYGCHLIPHGTEMTLDLQYRIPVVEILTPEGRIIRGVTFSSMIKYQ